KGINEEQVLAAVHLAAESGMQQLKLYFMLGLPQETEDDIQAIADLTLASKSIIDQKRSKIRLTVNLSPFIPKAGTAFERMPMASIDIIQRRNAFLKNKLTPLGIKINTESPQWSEVQAALARGDNSFARVLADIERPSLPAWRRATEQHQVDVDHFAHQEWDTKIKLPWVNNNQIPGH
ncbi:MAG TPA: hypothetical protein VF318_09110, partial [Dehalococcoidales bacterium]